MGRSCVDFLPQCQNEENYQFHAPAASCMEKVSFYALNRTRCETQSWSDKEKHSFLSWQSNAGQPTPLLCFCHMRVLLLQQEIIEGRKSSKPPHRLPESIQKELDKRSIGDRLGIQLHSV
jgi:hypothetical protein